MAPSQNDTEVCPHCGSLETKRNGFKETKNGSILKFRCKSCGKVFSESFDFLFKIISNNSLIKFTANSTYKNMTELCKLFYIDDATLNKKITLLGQSFQKRYQRRFKVGFVEKETQLKFEMKDGSELVFKITYDRTHAFKKVEILEGFRSENLDKEIDKFLKSKNGYHFISHAKNKKVALDRLSFIVNSYFKIKSLQK